MGAELMQPRSIVVSCFAGWHGFDLAQGLERSGLLQSLITLAKPSVIEKRYGIPRQRIRRLPSAALLHRGEWWLAEHGSPWLRDFYFERFCSLYDRFTLSALDRHTRVLVAWYPFASNSLKAAASKGIATVLDVGSTHPHHQYRLLCRSHRQFDLSMPWSSSRVLSHTWAFDLVDRIMVPSRAVEDTFLMAGVAAEKLCRNPYGIDAEIFKPSQPFRRSSPFDANNPLKVLTVASLTPRKGAKALLEICRYFQSRPEIAFTMVGSIDTLFRQKLKSIPANLTILKAGSHQWLANQYQLHQVSLLPSLEEGFARVLLEAAASGCFLLATEPTGLSDLLEKDSSVGVLLSGDTVRSAIDCLEEILAGKCALGDLSIEARNYFSRSSYQQRAVDLLAELAGTV